MKQIKKKKYNTNLNFLCTIHQFKKKCIFLLNLPDMFWNFNINIIRIFCNITELFILNLDIITCVTIHIDTKDNVTFFSEIL